MGKLTETGVKSFVNFYTHWGLLEYSRYQLSTQKECNEHYTLKNSNNKKINKYGGISHHDPVVHCLYCSSYQTIYLVSDLPLHNLYSKPLFLLLECVEGKLCLPAIRKT